MMCRDCGKDGFTGPTAVHNHKVEAHGAPAGKRTRRAAAQATDKPRRKYARRAAAAAEDEPKRKYTRRNRVAAQAVEPALEPIRPISVSDPSEAPGLRGRPVRQRRHRSRRRLPLPHVPKPALWSGSARGSVHRLDPWPKPGPTGQPSATSTSPEPSHTPTSLGASELPRTRF